MLEQFLNKQQATNYLDGTKDNVCRKIDIKTELGDVEALDCECEVLELP